MTDDEQRQMHAWLDDRDRLLRENAKLEDEVRRLRGLVAMAGGRDAGVAEANDAEPNDARAILNLLDEAGYGFCAWCDGGNPHDAECPAFTPDGDVR